MTLILNDDDVARVLTMKECVSVLEEAFLEMGRGGVVNAPRRDSFLALPQRPDGYYAFKTMEGGIERLGVLAQRINSDLITYPEVEGVPVRVKVPAAPGNRYVGLVFLYSSENLELLAIITDGHLQRMRVAGTTGVGAKYLTREDAKTAALLGAGWQAETAAWALAAVRPLSKIKVFSPTREKRKTFAKKVEATLGIEVVPVEGALEAVEGSDIVACATNSSGVVVKGEWIESGMHLTSILPTEFDEEAWQKSDLIITSSPGGSGGYTTYTSANLKVSLAQSMEGQVKVEEERFQRYEKKIYFLSDLLMKKAPKRTSPSQITMMNKNWGLGIEFASVGKLVYDRAKARGIGKEIPGDWFSQTSHP